MKYLKASQTILILILTLFCGCYFTSHEFLQNNQPLNFRQNFFLNNSFSIALPEGGDISPNKHYYYKVLYSKWLGFSAGDYSISRLALIYDKYIPEPYDLCTNTKKNSRTPQEFILYISSNSSSDDYIKKTRFADLVFKGHWFRLYIATSYNDRLLPDSTLQKYRLGEDDKLFKKISESILIKVNNRWVKPTVRKLGTSLTY